MSAAPAIVVTGGREYRPKNRGDKTLLELFIVGVRGLKAYPCRRLDDGKPVGQVTYRLKMWDTRSAIAAAMGPGGAILFITYAKVMRRSTSIIEPPAVVRISCLPASV